MCLISSAITSCIEYSVGGISKLYITNSDYISQYNYSNIDLYFNIVSSFSPNTTTYTALTAVTFFQFNTNPDVTEFEENLIQSTGGDYYEKKLSTSFIKMDANKREVLSQLLQSKNLIIMFKDNNGNWWVFGEPTKGARITEYKAATSTSDGDNSYNVVFTLSSCDKLKNVRTAYLPTIGIN
jgi:hypothetical protein